MESSSFFDARFDAIVEDALKVYHCPGLSIAVVHKGTTDAKVHHPATISSAQKLHSLSQGLIANAIIRVMALRTSHLKHR
jgi:hypothetical protein